MQTGLAGSLMRYGSNGRSDCSAVNAAPRRGAVAAGLAGTLPHYDHGSRSKRGSGVGLRSEKGS